jgi:ribosome-associated heat shock protein Hsp15
VEQARVDQWLWSVRIFKTRSAAADACRGGHVRVNGAPAKAATPVRAGDRVQARAHGRNRELEVVEALTKRVGAELAAAAMVDHTPPEPEVDRTRVAERERGAGRPTKRERRQLDRWRG